MRRSQDTGSGACETLAPDAPTHRLASGTVRTSSPVLGLEGGIALRPQPLPRASLPAADAPVIADIETVWDMARFATPRTPLVVCRIGDVDSFSTSEEALVADLPVKFPGTDYRVPVELAGLEETLQRIADVEATLNPWVDDAYIYLSLQRSPVTPGGLMRGAGVHSDSVQGRRIAEKTVIEHGYVVSDVDTTRFFVHGFDLSGVDVASEYLNAHFAEQADRRASFQAQPYEIALFDAYCVHEAVPAARARMRTFLRVITSLRRFDRLGNTHNALFDYAWEMVPRPVPTDLRGLSQRIQDDAL